jgi:MtN3 and saliva related transmembrane protein
MNVFDVVQLVGGLILCVGSLPQLEQIVRTKSVGDINIVSIITMVIGITLMEIYAVHSELVMFTITNTISLFLAIAKLSLKIYYTKKN